MGILKTGISMGRGFSYLIMAIVTMVCILMVSPREMELMLGVMDLFIRDSLRMD